MSTTSSAIRIVAGLPGRVSKRTEQIIRREFNVRCPMRDDVKLAVDLLRPDDQEPHPVVLMRTPYNKAPSNRSPFLERLARSGYVVAIQDCRGRFNSDGVFDPYRNERRDGFDTINWIADQPWCDGNVGMIGGSYNGQTQWFAAAEAPSALKAIVPSVSPPGHPFLNEPFWGGVMLMACPEWMIAMGYRSEVLSGMQGLYAHPQPHLELLPLARIAPAAGTALDWWEAWLSHPTFDDYWQSHGYEDAWPQMQVAALNVTGWWDMNSAGAPRNYRALRDHARDTPTRDSQRLVIGPWAHWVNHQRSLSGVDFGPDAISDLDGYTHRFFDHWLRGVSNGLDEVAPVHVFVTGANQWWEADDWPLPGTQDTAFYFHSEGDANTHRGNGRLSQIAPAAEAPDVFVSDPQDPVRSPWTMHDGPVDDRAVTARPDILCYTSKPFNAPLDIVGPVCAVLYASSSAGDCDWHVRLYDVHPDGAARFMCHGVLRARFRNGFTSPELLEPGAVEKYEIDMAAAGARLFAGHRIRLSVSSSWFPRFERNPQTGASNWMTDDSAPETAEQIVYHDAIRPSHLVLPVISHARPIEEAA